MQHAAYILLDVLFIGIPVVYSYLSFSTKIKKYYKTLFALFIFSILIFYIFDPIAVRWRAWKYNPEKTIGVQFQGAAIETLLSSLLVCFVIGVYTLVSAEKEEK